MSKYLIVNATALDRSGGLNILRQFVENIPQDENKWVIFISDSVEVTNGNPNVRLEKIEGVKPLHKRFFWDCIGIKIWLKKNNIKPIASVSLQNTGFSVGISVPSFIYYHQPIPFFPYKWNLLKRNQRSLWFYKYIYPFFIKLFLKKNTKVFVQLDFIKEGFNKKFKHPKELIKIYSPSVFVPTQKIKKNKEIDTTDSLNLFFPAMPYFYKNHKVLEEALKLTDTNMSVFFTINQTDRYFQDKRVKLIGLQPYENICQLYQTCDALLFPSYIETYGLPLLEAAMTGMPIIAADLPYAREVLSGYEGVAFVAHDNPEAWVNAIKSLQKGKRYKPIDISSRPGWKELFTEIKSSI